MQEENTGCLEVSLVGKMIPAELTQCSNCKTYRMKIRCLVMKALILQLVSIQKDRKRQARDERKTETWAEMNSANNLHSYRVMLIPEFHIKQILGQPKNDGSLSILEILC